MQRIVYARADGGVSFSHPNDARLEEDGSVTDGPGIDQEMFDKWKESAKAEWLPATMHTIDQVITPAMFKFHGSRSAATVSRSGKVKFADNGLVWDGTKVVADMALCRQVHMDRIRPERDKALLKADIDLSRAQDGNDIAEQTRIRARRKALRDTPQTFQATLDAAATPEDLDARWPAELPPRQD